MRESLDRDWTVYPRMESYVFAPTLAALIETRAGRWCMNRRGVTGFSVSRI